MFLFIVYTIVFYYQVILGIIFCCNSRYNLQIFIDSIIVIPNVIIVLDFYHIVFTSTFELRNLGMHMPILAPIYVGSHMR